MHFVSVTTDMKYGKICTRHRFEFCILDSVASSLKKPALVPSLIPNFKNLPAKQKENENAMGEGGHSDFVGVDGILKISTLVERRN